MLIKILTKATHCNVLLVILVQMAFVLSITNCGGGGGGTNAESAATIVVSSTKGKLAQGYVGGGQV